MAKGEPSLVPEWLRNTGSGTVGSTSSNHLSSSDGPLLASPKRNRNLKNISNLNGSHSSFQDRSSYNNSRRTSGSNGSNKQDKNSFGRSFSSSRNQPFKDREILDTWDSEYTDSLSSIIAGRIQKDNLRRSQSMVSRRASELSPRAVVTDLKNNSRNLNGGENGAVSTAPGTTGIQKVSFERDFPVLGSDDRPMTPDMSRLSSLKLGKSVQGMPIGTSPSMGNEVWTSALAEAPIGLGSSSVSSPLAQDHSPYAAAAAPVSATISSGSSTLNGFNKSGALGQSQVQAAVRPQNTSQQSVQIQRFEELPSMGSKRLIPMAPSMPKTLVLNPSDKLKPKTAMKTNEAVSGPKNGLQQVSPLQLGNQPAHGGLRADCTKLSSTGKLLVLKPSRENGLLPSQTAALPCLAVNGQSTCASSLASVPLKIANNAKLVDKKCSQAQLQSRNDFFNLVRKKSMGNPSSAADSGGVVSGMQSSDEQKENHGSSPTPTESDGEVKCTSDLCDSTESLSINRDSDLSDDALIHPNEEEEAFLRSLGWEASDGDEGGLTEEEINAFVQKLKILNPASKLCRGLQLLMSTKTEAQASSSAGASCEMRTADS